MLTNCLNLGDANLLQPQVLKTLTSELQHVGCLCERSDQTAKNSSSYEWKILMNHCMNRPNL